MTPPVQRLHPQVKAAPTIEGLKPHDHICCIYGTEAEHRAVVTPFIRAGLERDEKVVYVVDARTAGTILGYLQEEGTDAEAACRRGRLVILDRDDTYLREGRFDPAAMVRLLERETARALAEGCSALRVTGEMSWALRGRPGSNRLIEYENLLNEFFPAHPALALCQYDRRRFPPDILLDILRTHPLAVIGTEVYDNFYYVPPEDITTGRQDEATLERWLASLAERRGAEHERRLLLDRLTCHGEWLQQLIHAASHDLRSPLVSVEGFTAELATGLAELSRLLREKGSGPDTEADITRLLDRDLPESLHYISAGVKRMSALLSGLLRVSHLGRADLQVEALDMDRLVADALAAMRFQLRESGAEVEAGKLPPALGDSGQVSQVLANLLGNAVAHTVPGRPPRIRVTGRVHNGEVRYCVEDNGPGIPPGLRERVFALFYRANPDRPGDGVGLAIVRTALDRLGGRAWVDSEEGRGSRFWFSLPAPGRQAAIKES